MKKEELRIGNLVQIFNPGMIEGDEVLVKPCLWELTIDNGEDIDDAEKFIPILLTRMWLIQFGFKENKHGFTHRQLSCVITKGIFDFWGFWFRFTDPKTKKMIKAHIVDIEYVHQLQNIVFTHEEFELILKPW